MSGQLEDNVRKYATAYNRSRDRWRGSIHGTSSCGITTVKSQTVTNIVVEHLKCDINEMIVSSSAGVIFFSGTGCFAGIYVFFITIIIIQ
jgi:hypothetical protein